MRFTKMHGLGNDYLYVYGGVPGDIRDICTRLSDRHFGAGSDGMIFISPSTRADFRMRIFNADGSEAMMCGNGIRCVGKYVYEKGYTDRTRLTVETLSGIRNLELTVIGGKVRYVTVDMGKAQVSEDLRLHVFGGDVTCTPVSVGNPHAVVCTDNADGVALELLGSQIGQDGAFPDGANVEFAEVTGDNSLRMRVFERGSGVTMACGTGACAAAAAAVSKGICSYDAPVSVKLDGGILEVTVTRDMRIMMTGPAETVYEGETALC